MVWLSGLSACLRIKGSLVRFPVRVHAWVAGQVPSGGRERGHHTLMFLSLSFSLPSPLSKNNKIFKKIFLFKKAQPDTTSHLLGRLQFLKMENKVWTRCREIGSFIFAGGSVNSFSHCGKQFVVSIKAKYRITRWPSIFTSRYMPHRTESYSNTHLYMHVHSSTVHNSQKVETKIHQWMNG